MRNLTGIISQGFRFVAQDVDGDIYQYSHKPLPKFKAEGWDSAELADAYCSLLKLGHHRNPEWMFALVHLSTHTAFVDEDGKLIGVVKDMEQAELDLDETQDGAVDLVNNPPHYNQSGIECIEAIRAALGEVGFASYCKGNALKYVWRCDHKGGQEDIKKAVWYLNKLISVSSTS